MLHAIRLSTGEFRVVESKGTHVVMTNEAFHDYVNVSRMLRDDIRRFTKESVELHRRISDDAEMISSLRAKLAAVEGTSKELSRQKDALEQSVASIKEELAKLRDDLAHAESLNKNLKRICRERANQVRGIPKNSDGYVVLVSQEWREKAQNGQLIRGYKTTIQSPHDAGMDDETAKRQIFDDLVNGVLADLGCPYYEQINGKPAEPIEEMSMYRLIFTADYRSGWLVTIYTTGPLKVPPHRRPPQKQRNQGGNQNDQHKSGRGAEKSAEESG